jgi:hypothetical protein
MPSSEREKWMTGDFALLKQYLFMGKQLLAFMKSLGTKRPPIDQSVTILALTEAILLEEITSVLRDPNDNSNGRHALNEHIVFLMNREHQPLRWTGISRTDRRIQDPVERLLKNTTQEEIGSIVFIERRHRRTTSDLNLKINLLMFIFPNIGFTSLITQARATCGR